jgi:hypothetical protein
LFEVVFTHTWSGSYGLAREALGRFHRGIDALAGVRWIGWGEWHAACLDLYAGRPEDAVKHLDISRSMFEADHLAAGVAAARTVELTAYRMAGDDDAFAAARGALDAMRGSRGWTPYTDHSIAQELVERRRRDGPSEDLRAEYGQLVEQSAERPVHHALFLLGLAELDLAAGRDNAALVDQARAVAARHSLAYLLAHAAISDHRAGRVDTATALSMIDATRCELTTRHEGPARDPEDYCLGPQRSAHELFFP